MLFNFCQMLRIENILCGKKIDVEEIADFLHDFCILQSVNLYPVDGIRPDERRKLFDGSSLMIFQNFCVVCYRNAGESAYGWLPYNSAFRLAGCFLSWHFRFNQYVSVPPLFCRCIYRSGKTACLMRCRHERFLQYLTAFATFFFGPFLLHCTRIRCRTVRLLPLLP